jgi:DNA-directed RNA polymerase subunit RPC12/RpoP
MVKTVTSLKIGYIIRSIIGAILLIAIGFILLWLKSINKWWSWILIALPGSALIYAISQIPNGIRALKYILAAKTVEEFTQRDELIARAMDRNAKNAALEKFKKLPIIISYICFDESNNSSVAFDILDPDLETTEYVRLSLLYYAKILFTIDPNQKEALSAYVFLLNATNLISEAQITKEMDILKISDIEDVVTLSLPKERIYEYTARMYFVSQEERTIKTSLPLRGYLQQMTFSVPVLIAGAIKQCDVSDIELIQLGLKYMNAQYNSGVDFKNIFNLAKLPNEAFMAALQSPERKIFHKYVYYRCTECPEKLRLSRGNGKIFARCPNCSNKSMVDTF